LGDTLVRDNNEDNKIYVSRSWTLGVNEIYALKRTRVGERVVILGGFEWVKTCDISPHHVWRYKLSPSERVEDYLSEICIIYPSSLQPTAIPCLPSNIEWNIFVLDHMLYLASHRQKE